MSALIILFGMGIIVSLIWFISNSIIESKEDNDPIAAQKQITENILKENEQKIIDFYKPYLSTLHLKKQQLIYKDDYGDIIETDWDNEKDRFVKNKMKLLIEPLYFNAINEFDRTVSLENYKKSFRTDVQNWIKDDIVSEIGYMIEMAIIDYEYESSIKEIDEEQTTIDYNLDDPILFEKSIANNFTHFGWETKETKRTGDQGADVIAQKDDYRIIVQCKLYSTPVGNKAIQEVFSAMKFYKGDEAIVITNASFTKSAQQLADSTDVILMHYSDLSDYLEKSNEVGATSTNFDIVDDPVLAALKAQKDNIETMIDGGIVTQKTIMKDSEFPIVCNLCKAKYKISVNALPEKNKKAHLECPECKTGFSLSLEENYYTCEYCNKQFNLIKQKIAHLDVCEEYKLKSYECKHCDSKLILEDDEFEDYMSNGFLNPVCPDCDKPTYLKLNSNK
jgi:restriction system protein